MMISRKLFIVLLAVFVFIASCNAQRPSSCEDVDCPTGYRCTENPRPRCERIGCTKEWNPVCGVNGVTYFNLCELSAAGVELAYPGQCRIELDDPVDDVHFVDDNDIDFNNIDGEEYVVDDAIEDDPAVEYDEVAYDELPIDEEYFEPEIAEEFFEEAAEEVNGEFPTEEYFVEAAEEEIALHFEEVPDEYFEPEEEYVELPLQESVDEVSGCPVFYAPVCAKNGATYYNGCFLAFEGEEVDYDGECVLYVEDN